MRRTGYADGNGVYYLLQDQLKSTSVIVSEGGAEAARQYYYPFGGNRGGAAFSELTTKRFTGQYHEQGLPGAEGLSYYNARWYDPQLGRFTSPDTLVPKPQNPQDFNRYSYARNNPTKYDDPDGHCPRPPADMGTTICFALFIKPATVKLPLALSVLHGDNRDFQADSDPTASRGYIWISTVSFRSNGKGGYDYAFERDGFPWAEAYAYEPGKPARIIFQDPAIYSDPYDLFAIEPNITWKAQIAMISQRALHLGSPPSQSHVGFPAYPNRWWR